MILMSLIALSLFSSCAEQDYSAKINPLLDKYIEAWNTGNLSDLSSIVDFSFELRKIPDLEPVRGIKNLEDYIVRSRTAVPDFFLKDTEKLLVGMSLNLIVIKIYI